jgi:hypothetical protein
MEQTVGLLTADPFDPEAFRTSIMQHQAKFAERQTLGLTVLTDHLVEMSAEDRLEYAERLRKILVRPPKGSTSVSGRVGGEHRPPVSHSRDLDAQTVIAPAQ